VKSAGSIPPAPPCRTILQFWENPMDDSKSKAVATSKTSHFCFILIEIIALHSSIQISLHKKTYKILKIQLHVTQFRVYYQVINFYRKEIITLSLSKKAPAKMVNHLINGLEASIKLETSETSRPCKCSKF
jgi:hypothetical protein